MAARLESAFGEMLWVASDPMRALSKWGVQRSRSPLLGVWGYPPTLKSPNPSEEGGGHRRLLRSSMV
jgi:hypothetical protein